MTEEQEKTVAQVFLNGEMIPEDQAQLSIRDAGLQHGVGLFETMRSFGGRVFRLRQHVDQLIASARELGLSTELRPGPLCEVVERTLAENQASEARVKLMVTGGMQSMLKQAKGDVPGRPQPSVLVTVDPPTSYPPRVYEEGIVATIADPKANPFEPTAGHKTLNYWTRLRCLADAALRGAGESFWFSVTNHLCGGSVSNVMLVKDGVLMTPIAKGEEANGALPSAVRPGIMRAALLELAEELGLGVERKMLSIDDLLAADEVMVSNSSWLLIPVVQVEAEKIADGKVGPVMGKLAQGLFDLIDEEGL